MRDAIIDGSTVAKNVKRETKAALVISHDKILQAKTLQILNSLHFLKYQKNKWIKKPSKVFDGLYDNFRNSVNVCSSSRQQHWALLTNLHFLCKYFFAFNMINSARFYAILPCQNVFFKGKRSRYLANVSPRLFLCQ